MARPRMRLADDIDRPWSGGGGRRRAKWSVTVWLIIANTAGFVGQSVLGPRMEAVAAFTLRDGVHRLQLWRWVSYAFLHRDPGHLIFNMLALFFFGPIVENRLKGLRFLAFYLLCAIGGGLVYWILSRVQILDAGESTRLLGASGAVLGTVAGAAKIAPDRQMRLLFPPISVRLLWLAWGYFAVAVFIIATAGTNAGGEAAHLGGLVVGFILIRNTRWLGMRSNVGPTKPRRFWKPGDPPEKFFNPDA